MRKTERIITTALVVGFVAFCICATKNRHDAESELASKKLRAVAHQVIGSQSAKSRNPASTTAGASATVDQPGARDRWIAKFFPNGVSAHPTASVPDDFAQIRKHERELALKKLQESGSKIDSDGIGVLPQFSAVPRASLHDDELLDQAAVLNSHWAIFDQQQMPQGSPVVYDFNRNRWGVMTGMVEVAVSDQQHFDETLSGLQARGYTAVGDRTNETVYVVAGARTLQNINKVSSELKNLVGQNQVKAETIFVWRSPQ